MTAMIPPGTQMDNHRVETLLGAGGMAEVYKAWHTGLQRHEALKALLPNLAMDRQFVERFLHEARTAAGLHHPNIATIHTVSTPQSAQPYFTMQMIEGGDLSDLLHDGERLSLSEALPLLTQIAEALDYAHRHGVVHRDVKPANILLERDGDKQIRVKLVDFGIARAQQGVGRDTRLTQAGMIVGTPEYMSPEQADGRADIDYRTDIYSLRIVVYEMLCGQPPFRDAVNTSAISVIMCHMRDTPVLPSLRVGNLPAGVDSIVLTALSKAPAERYNSCAVFIEALTSCLPVSPVHPTVQKLSPRKPAVSAPRRSRAGEYAALCFVAAGCFLFFGRIWQQHLVREDHMPVIAFREPVVNENKNDAISRASKAKEIVDRVLVRMSGLKPNSDAHLLVDVEATHAKDEMRNQLHQAIDIATDAKRRDAANQMAWYEHARALYYLPDRVQADSVLHQAIQRFPDNLDLRLLKSKMEKHK